VTEKQYRKRRLSYTEQLKTVQCATISDSVPPLHCQLSKLLKTLTFTQATGHNIPVHDCHTLSVECQHALQNEVLQSVNVFAK